MRVPFNPPTGFVTDDTVFASPGRYKGGNMVRFFQGQWQTRGGWSNLASNSLTGVCRGVIPWSDAGSVLNIGFGTHTNLEVWKAGVINDVTPLLARPSMLLGAAPLSTTNTSATVVVSWPGHGMAVAATFIMAGAADTNGILAANLNGLRTITAATTNTFSFTAGSAATSTNTGGGAAVTITPQAAFVAGQIDGTGGAGYGTGAYGVGAYGAPSTADYFPRTWDLSIYETGDLYACPRGQTIYRWQQNTASPAVALANAPWQVTSMLCNEERQVMAFGCNRELDGIFDPLCIRWSDVEDPTDWTSTTANNAGEYILKGDGGIVRGINLGKYVLVFTTTSAYLGTWNGYPDGWSFDSLGTGCGLIGPNAVAIGFGNALTVMWLSPDVQFWGYTLGGVPTPVDCPIRTDLMNNISVGQSDKIYATTITSYGEAEWFYPDARDGLENSRSVTVSDEGWWSGMLARTAFCDRGPGDAPIGVAYGGAAYWHETGAYADGGVLTGYIETTDFYMDEAENTLKLNGMWPNFKDQTGPVSLTLYGRDTPQGTERTFGPWVLTPGLPKKSLRATARIFRARYDFSSAPSYVRSGKHEFDAETVGGR